MTDENEPLFDLRDVNLEWSDVLSQYLIAKITLQKQNQQLETDYKQLKIANDNLKAQLHQAQLDLVRAQGKAIIDDARVDID